MTTVPSRPVPHYVLLSDASSNPRASSLARSVLLPLRSVTQPRIRVHYARRPTFICNGIFVPHENSPFRTHAYLGVVPFQDTPNDRTIRAFYRSLFLALQGESWSPHGEANALLDRQNLLHTSASIGDVFEVVAPDLTRIDMIDSRGFVRIA